MTNIIHTIAVTAVVEHQGKFLFIERHGSEGEFGNQWVFPGGKVHSDEDIVQGLTREISEEVGLIEFKSIHFLSSYKFTRKDGSSTQGLVFLLRTEYSDLCLDTGSVNNHAWISPADVIDYLNAGRTIYGMEVHVRNALLAMNGISLPVEATSVSAYQTARCVMSKDYLEAIGSPDWNPAQVNSESWLFPNRGAWGAV